MTTGTAAAVNGRVEPNVYPDPTVRIEPIAIIGMRGRFPGANDLDQYWHNLSEGIESISILSQEDMRSAGVPDHLSRMPGWVNASPVLDDIDQFDAEFFGFSARDASLTDPQHRLFLETAWEALEDAGYDPSSYAGAIGVFGGAEMSTYLYHLYKNADALKYVDGMQLMVTNDKDHLCTQVSYRLNLRGPSVTIQTTCSTSLVAISFACESLLHGRCDMALAGGVTVRVPQRGGYYYAAGSILSPDGHCRPFDANAQGTIVGSGVGLVVLKRLSDALADRDNVRAVILGAGVNNDGNDKVGYTAPSFRGQVSAIRAAHAMSGVSPDSIGYIEAHGTGTILGDPIEISALTEAMNTNNGRRGYCGLGSVKSNFGHLSCAAGVAGLIKTVLSLEHAAIPPTVHFSAPNPAIKLTESPFYITNRLHPWKRNGSPRRAGVSSFGVGGTNAHLVVEEAPVQTAALTQRPHQLIVLSARSNQALDDSTCRLAKHLNTHPELNLADVAHTLHVGRKPFQFRRSVVSGCNDAACIASALNTPESMGWAEAKANRSVVFMFPGQGSQYPGMAEGLYNSEPVVRSAIDLCAGILKPYLGSDIRRILFPGQRKRTKAAGVLKDTKWDQPALFTVEYAVALLWKSWGIMPSAVIGHSVGEFVAATLAGVMKLEDALRLIARRGQLVSALPRGSMLAVMAPAESLERFLNHEVSLAAINAPGFSVLSGPDSAIDSVEKSIVAESVPARRLHTSHAFHSSMMDPILEEFRALVSGVTLCEPTTPFLATLTGDWAGTNVAQAEYWSAQLRSPVRFARGIGALICSDPPMGDESIYLEAGPGSTLVTFANEAARGAGRELITAASLPGPESQIADTESVLTALGRMWTHGVDVDWNGFHKTEPGARVSLPTYPFERQSYWVGELAGTAPPELETRDTSGWFQKPVWRETPPAWGDLTRLKGQRILVFDEGKGVGSAVSRRLARLGATAIMVRQGEAFERISEAEFLLDPTRAAGYRELAADVCSTGTRLAGVVHCWAAASPGETAFDAAANLSLLGPMRLAHALSAQPTVRPLPVLIVAQGTCRTDAEEALNSNRALGLGVSRVLPQEHPGLRVSHVDIQMHTGMANLLLSELAAGAPEPAVVLRRAHRYVEAYETVQIDSVITPLNLPERPVVFVTGGLGHMGLSLAEAMYDRIGARMVLVGRASMPDPSQWAEMSEDTSLSTDRREVLRRLAKMRDQRDELLVLTADFNNQEQVRKAVDDAIAHFGQVDLVVHGAARIDPAAFASVADTGPEVVEAQFSPKLRGLFYLIGAFEGRDPSRWVLHSSISTVLGGLGLGAYSGVNAVLDVLAESKGANWLSIDWDAWDNAAEAESASMPAAIRPPEGADAFLRLLGVDVGSRVVVVVNDLNTRLKAWVRISTEQQEKSPSVKRHPRPNLSSAFVEARTDTERKLSEIWGDQLGIQTVGIHDRFFDLGGHSLLAAQVASEICDRFQIELPVLKLFQAATISELAPLVDKAVAAGGFDDVVVELPTMETPAMDVTPIDTAAPGGAAKSSYRQFYNDVTRRLDRSGVGDASFFLNYGYISSKSGKGDEARYEVPEGVFNPSSIRLAYELIGSTELRERRVLDVGCGRGGTVRLMAEKLGAQACGVDLSPDAVAFCRRTHQEFGRFEVGDAEHLPFDDGAFEVVTNIESSHTYPNLRAFFGEVRRMLSSGGLFLYTDLLPVQRWLEVKALLIPLGFTIQGERDITPNVLASCDNVAETRSKAFGGDDAMIDNFLAVPGTAVYEQMRTGAWEYRIVRACL